MKANRFLLSTVLFISASLAFVSGCKYNVSQPLWDQPYKAPATPQITSVDPPSEAKPGVSTITIHGHNFIVAASDTAVSDSTIVYFGTTQADVVSMDSTTIVVLRPNLVSNSCTIKVAPHNAIVEATYGPYKIDPVYESYGGFLQNLQLGGITVDGAENLYVGETTSKYIHKITPDGNNTVIGTATNGPTDAQIGPDGNLYLTENNRKIDSVNLATNTVKTWTQLPPGKAVKVGDFGPDGYYYTGGPKTDLCIVPPNHPATLTAAQIKLAGSYATDEILAIRVYNGYVYVASRPNGTQTPAKIWRNQTIADSVGSQELVLDMGATAFASDLVTDIAFSSAGTMFIGTASVADPILIVDPATSKVDNFYKGIVPPYCNGFTWSKTSTYLYLISGNTAAAATWTVYRLDMGIPGAP